MPFVFGVKADKMKERYWMRMKPSNNKDVFVLEVHPKFQADAVNYDHVEVYLDRQLFLPMMLVKYNTEHVDEPGKPLVDSRDVFEFTDREKNASLLAKINQKIWQTEFIETEVPKNWKVNVIPLAPGAVVPPNAQAGGPQPPNPVRR